jgi:hypothetical protein
MASIAAMAAVLFPIITDLIITPVTIPKLDSPFYQPLAEINS